MISNQVKLSLFQLISKFEVSESVALIQKHVNITCLDEYYEPTSHFKKELKNIIVELNSEKIINIIKEILQSKRSFKKAVAPLYLFEERWEELRRCLLLNGLKIENKELIRVEPEIEGLMSSEDNLIKEIYNSGLGKSDEIVSLINNSSDDFVKQPADFNGCLGNIRTALETLGKAISEKIRDNANDNKDLTRWGNYISYLRSKEFINENEEKALTGVYSLLSEIHRPLIGFSEEELVRFSRTLGLSMCYYLIRRNNAD